MTIDKATWMNIQRRLKELGILKGDVDGIAGPVTLAALRGFQRINGLTSDGIPGTKTMAALFPPVDITDRILMGAEDEEDVKDVELPDETKLPEKTGAANVAGQMNNWPSQQYASMVKYYGMMGKNQTKIKLPFPMYLAWNKKSKITSMTVHEKVADSAIRCFNRVADAYTPKQIADIGLNLYGGSLNVRKMRGGNSWSIHSWGCAIDFDPARNQLKWGSDRARLAKADCVTFWKIWEAEGWVSLGRSKNYDWMHVQAAKL